MAQRAARKQRLAEWRFKRGLAMLAAGELVVTDRLHAHILSLLLDIPHVLLDNSYGKVAGFADQWTAAYGGLMRATGRAEAFETALACVAPQIVDGLGALHRRCGGLAPAPCGSSVGRRVGREGVRPGRYWGRP